MNSIYVDNFRGFNDTFIPLKDINFFVGENSTGKTSILKLIKTISEINFWFHLGFNSENAELGFFSEIVSKASTNKTSFKVGVMTNREDVGIVAFLLTFKEDDGKPIIREANYLIGDISYNFIITDKQIKYRFKKIDINDDINYQFYNWVNNNGLKNKSFKIAAIDTSLPKNIVFFQIQHIINENKTPTESKTDGLFFPQLFNNIVWIAPIRTEPQRTYDNYNTNFSPEGKHIPYLLKNILAKTDKKKLVKIKQIIDKFGKESGLFDTLKVYPLGKDKTAPFEIHIYFKGVPFKISNVGYGVSQILPILIEILARQEGSWFSIQQPEIHLHPKAQAAYGEFIFKAFKEQKQRFIIETHSDYLIDRFRLKINQSKIEDEISQVIFFEKNESFNKLTCIPINKDGTYTSKQPKSFREFFINEEINLLKI
jgi:predicted ATP-dependent endonuclease of OLD family